MFKVTRFTLVTLFSFCFFPFWGFAQDITGSIKGRVQDSSAQAIPYVAVSVLRTKDSSFVKAISTDSTGQFTLQNIPPGHYYAEVKLLGYKTTQSAPFKLNASHPEVNLGKLTLQPNVELLKAVTITSTKALVTHQPGKTVVNVAHSSLSAGNSVMELLRKSPGVFIDQDDNISLNGQQGVMVMINGRPTHLSSKQLSAFLKNLPAGSVVKVELITQPSAKYSAEGTAGIINIITKKEMATGWNGNIKLGAGYGHYWNYNGGIDLNYGGEKLNFYASYNYKHDKQKINLNMWRKFYAPTTDNPSSFMHQYSVIQFESDNHTAQMGLDYNLTKNQRIGVVLNGSFNDGGFTAHSPINFLNPDKLIDSSSTSESTTGSNWNNEQINLHHNIDLDKKGSKLTTNLDYSHFEQNSPQYITTTTTNADGNSLRLPLKRKGKQPTDIAIYAAKIDYTQVFKHDYKLEAGLKTSFVNTDNNSLFQINTTGQWQNDAGNTNHFKYKENINAAYASLSKTFKQGWSAKLGVRAEQANIKTHQITTDSVNKQDYIDLFPNLSVSKTINLDNVLSLSYSRRINRPNYQSLNPFVHYIDEYTYLSGNPYLQPEYSNKLALAYTFKKRYSAVLSYTHTNDIITQVINQDNLTHIISQTTGNISNKDIVQLNLSLPVKITNWWHTYNSAQIYYNHFNGIYSGYPLDLGYTSFMLNSYQSFVISNSLTADLTGMYRSASMMGPLKIDNMGMVSIGLKKALWDGRASVKLNVQDVFQTMKFTVSSDFGNIDIRNFTNINARTVNLTFTWNFGNQKIRVNKHDDSSIKNQEERIQKGKGQAQGL